MYTVFYSYHARASGYGLSTESETISNKIDRYILNSYDRDNSAQALGLTCVGAWNTFTLHYLSIGSDAPLEKKMKAESEEGQGIIARSGPGEAKQRDK